MEKETKLVTKQIYSVEEYSKIVGKTHAAILIQIKENRLPKGVGANMIGAQWVVSVSKEWMALWNS